MKNILPFLCCLLLLPFSPAKAEDGYRLWLRYDRIEDAPRLESYRSAVQSVWKTDESASLLAASQELHEGLKGLLGREIPAGNQWASGALLIGTYESAALLREMVAASEVEGLGSEGYVILSTTHKGKKGIVITAQTDVGVLYGTFHFLRLLQTQQEIAALHIRSVPQVQIRILNHWDNLDRTVERGYAGFSIWNWHQLPEVIDPRYIDYARANASIGINGTVLTNVNANALILRPDYLQKVKALADVFRPWGIKVYLTARFSAPIDLGKMKTADPLDPAVQQWWKEKVNEVYAQIPDFGGFVVKANSEGQPGPQNYGRSHADGANMLADAVAPHGGLVMWRAFVYSNEEPEDRHKQANIEFEALDGTFRDNVLIQVKNGAIDFQPREPFHPLFGALKQTPLMMEFQITQEYLGQGTHLVYLGSLFKEVLDADTYLKGKGSTVAKVIDGSLTGQAHTAMAGVSNIGSDRNWTSHPFGQANWYAFGRLAWDHELSAAAIAEEWIRMTFVQDEATVRTIRDLMLASHQAAVNYMTPLGLHHIMGPDHHYGPGPWVSRMPRADWTSTYYHRADSIGIGFDRTASGTDAVSQYQPAVAALFASPQTCPERYLLWFHHVSWNQPLPTGRTLWQELCLRYQEGVLQVSRFAADWEGLKAHIDAARWEHVRALLRIQEKEAAWWRDACLSYFQTFSRLPFPDGIPQPPHSLEYYEALRYPYAPGIRPRW